MDSHSYSGFNAPDASFLQELTVEDPSKEVYAAGQSPQQRQYQAYPGMHHSPYPPVADIPPGSYYNGQYPTDPYYANQPPYPQRTKYSDGAYAANSTISPHPSPNVQVPSRSIPNNAPSQWSESPQMSQYQQVHYPPQTSFQSGSRMAGSGYSQAAVQHQQYPVVQHPYSGASGSYSSNEMVPQPPPAAYSSAGIPQHASHTQMPMNGELLTHGPLAPHQQFPHQGPPKPPQSSKAVKRPKMRPALSKSQPSTYLLPQPAYLSEHPPNAQNTPSATSFTPSFVELPSSQPLPSPPIQCQGKVISAKIEEAPQLERAPACEPQPAIAPTLEKQVQEGELNRTMNLPLSAACQGPPGSASKTLESHPLDSISSMPSVRPPLSPCTSSGQLVDTPISADPPLECRSLNSQVPESSPPPPSLKPTAQPTQNPITQEMLIRLPPLLPKEEQEENFVDTPETTQAHSRAAGPPPPCTKRPRGRKRKTDVQDEDQNITISSATNIPSSAVVKRKASIGMSNVAKRSRRKTTKPRDDNVGLDDKDEAGVTLHSEATPVSDLPTLEDEDTMAAAATEAEATVEEEEDDDDGNESGTTATETTPNLNRPKPLPKLRPPRIKKKRTLKSLVKKKRRGAYYFGAESDGSDTDDAVADPGEAEDQEGSSNAVADKDRGNGKGRRRRGRAAPIKKGGSRAMLTAVASSQSLSRMSEESISIDSAARRSGRWTGDARKKYTIDSVDFGLSEDGSGGADSDNEGTRGTQKRADADFVDLKVVEKILGRRMSTRPVKKPKRSQKVQPPESSDSPEIPSVVKQETHSADNASEKLPENQATDKKTVDKPREQDEVEEEEEQVEEFYIKYKGFSYMHCEWRTLDEITDPRIATKMKKFLAKNGTKNESSIPLDADEEEDEDDGVAVLFNPDYVEVDRVLDIRIYNRDGELVTDEVLNPDGSKRAPCGKRNGKKSKKRRGRPPKKLATTEGESEEEEDEDGKATDSETQDSMVNTNEDNEDSPPTVTYYLVKWKSLPYEESTWELAEDVDPTKVKEFMRIRNPPKNPPVIRDSNHKIIRPDPSSWRPITQEDQETGYKNGNRLREYQVEGVSWLAYCWYNRRNCILADEMGLGKTVQSIAFLLEIVKAGVAGPFLILVPLSTVGNWQREFENWSDLNAIVYHGSAISRSMIQEYELFYPRSGSKTLARSSSSGSNLVFSQYRHDVYKFHAVITTFEVLMSDIEFFGRMHWAVAIIDEAHRLKNKKCKLGEGLRYLDLDHRVLLTGTPLQNNVEELFGLLNFLEPERFSCATTFLAEFGELKTEAQVEDLKTLLKPMMLRRLKEDVEKSLAPKEETIIEVELTNLQKKYYRAIMERNFTFLCKGTTGSNMPNLMNVMMELRKCCNHPFLIKGAEDAILEEQRTLAEADPSKPYNEERQMFSALLNASGKLVLIHKLLPKLKAGGHKVLIFSQMIRVLDILEDYLVYQGFTYERIDGRIHGLLRQEAIDRFCNDPDKFVFLLCTKAGGLGINLTAADVVIIYDSDWNPQNDLQAQARCHRIGQQKMVKVYRLITRNTYEREMFDRASLKLGLDKAVLQSTSAHARQAQLSKKEVEELLKKGAYGALMDDDKAGDDFCEEDIDQILQSRAHVVQLEQGEKNSTFSKATFSVSDNRNDIALDDPDFWQKWAKKAGVEEVGLEFEDLIMTTPRQRRQTHRYTAELNEQQQQASSTLSHSQSTSRLPNGKTGTASDADSAAGGSDAENSSGDSSGGEDNAEDGTTGDRGHKSSSKKGKRSRGAGGVRGSTEAIDRVDLFRVEKCLFTWSWGRWAYAMDCVPFKRVMNATEMEHISRVILTYALKATPALTAAGGDSRIRTVVGEMVEPPPPRTMADVVQALRSYSSTPNGCLSRGGGGIRRTRRGAGRLGGTESPNAPSTPATPSFDADTPKPEDAEKNEDETGSSKLYGSSGGGGDFGLSSDSFKRHLMRAGGRLLARVYTLYFLHAEIVGLELAEGLCDGSLDHTAFNQLAGSLPPLKALDADVPADWWDSCCDKCLLLGVFKHGWEKYLAIRDDPAFCFYHRVYGPNAPAIPIPFTMGGVAKKLGEVKDEAVEEQDAMADSKSKTTTDKSNLVIEEQPSETATDGVVSTTEVTPKPEKEELMAEAPPSSTTKTKTEEDEKELKGNSEDNIELPPALLLFPAVVDLNSRMRKLISYFQRVRAQVELDAVHSLRGGVVATAVGLSMDSISTVTSQPYMEQRLVKWSRREEADFYRVVSSFGVEQVMQQSITPTKARASSTALADKVFVGYNWSTFKMLANLSKKSDQAITEYYNAFLTMCHRVCRESLPEGLPPPVSSLPTTTTYGSCLAEDEIPIAPISEERATRTLSRIKLLNRIRSYILCHDHLEERLGLCQRSSDLPEWWIPGRHDGELLRAAAKHGLARTDLNILPDKEFSFSRVAALIQRQLMKHPSALNGVAPPVTPASSATAAAPQADAIASSTASASGMSLSEVEARASMANAASRAARAVAAGLQSRISEVATTTAGDDDNELPEHAEETTSEDKDEVEKKLDVEMKEVDDGGEDKDTPSSSSTMPTGMTNDQFAWSLKFATNLAIAWPKDRTIHNRLDMVCQCVETGHWPLPRRYVLSSVDGEAGRYAAVPEQQQHGTPSSRDASPAPNDSTASYYSQHHKKSSTSAADVAAATLSALSAAGYSGIDQILALQAAAVAAASTGTAGVAASSSTQPSSSESARRGAGGRGGGRGSRGGRGRGRGSRTGGYSHEDFASVASLAARSSSSTSSGSSGGGGVISSSRGSRGSRSGSGQMLPPRGGGSSMSAAGLSPSTSGSSTRGRKRKFGAGTDVSVPSSSADKPSSSLPPPDSAAWEVNVPLISLVNGTLIHGDKAPKRRHLEAWLVAHPDYMPYSVEPEDQVIFNKVARSRGQDTSAMDALAYRHYMTSLLSKAANFAATTSHRSSTTAAATLEQQQQQQQQQLLALAAAAVYSNNPAYAGMIASALGYSQLPKAADPPKNESMSSGDTVASSSSAGSSQTTDSIHSMFAAYQQAASFMNAAYSLYNPALYNTATTSQGYGGVTAGSSSSSSSDMSTLLNSVFAAAAAAAATQQTTTAAATSPAVATLSSAAPATSTTTPGATDNADQPSTAPTLSPPPTATHPHQEGDTKGEQAKPSSPNEVGVGGDVLDLSKQE